jgi:serine/threonine-protein kinase
MYLAQDAAGQRVALKELAFALAPSANSIDAFEREARLLREIVDPAVPRFLSSFREGDGPRLRLYLAQEFVEGETLAQRLTRGALDEAACRDLARQVLRVLDSLHRRSPRVLHRDLKPQNLILRPDGRVALVDFGAARELLRDVTHGATFVGTFGYMPFEQMGGTVDERSDLYALGATLAHALTGMPPADLVGSSLVGAVEAHTRLSAGLRTLLARLLAPRRDDRCRSAQEALDLLEGRGRALLHAPQFERLLAPADWGQPAWFAALLLLVATAGTLAVLVAA